MQRSRYSTLRLAAVALAFWTTVGLIFSLPKLAAPDPAGGRLDVLLASLAEWWSWGLVSFIVPWFDARLPFPDTLSARRLTAHVAAGLILTACFTVLSTAVAAALGAADWHRIVDGRLLVEAAKGMYLWELLVYGCITGAWLTYRYHRRSVEAELALARLERDYADARLHTLRMQLDPHFLFNTLNTISAHVQAEPRQARQMIEHLAELLRQTLEPGYRQDVPLAEELDFLEHYLAIQRIRFQGRLTVELKVTPEMRSALVPSLILQPLVENAFRHGLANRTDDGRIEIRAERQADCLVIKVADNGAGLAQNWEFSHHAGVGLTVTRERVEAHGKGRLVLRSGEQGGAEAEISLPFRSAFDIAVP